VVKLEQALYREFEVRMPTLQAKASLTMCSGVTTAAARLVDASVRVAMRASTAGRRSSIQMASKAFGPLPIFYSNDYSTDLG